MPPRRRVRFAMPEPDRSLPTQSMIQGAIPSGGKSKGNCLCLSLETSGTASSMRRCPSGIGGVSKTWALTRGQEGTANRLDGVDRLAQFQSCALAVRTLLLVSRAITGHLAYIR